MPERETPQWREESRFYRVRPGVGWWVALLVVPLLLGAIGWAGFADHRVTGQAVPGVEASAPTPNPTGSPPSTLAPTQPGRPAQPAPSNLPYGPFSIVRSADGFVLGGKMPDAEQKAAFLEAISMGLPGAVVTDRLTVDAGIRVPDIALLGGVFGVTGNVPGFSLVVDRGVLTLTGEAPTERDRSTVESAAAEAWPGVPIVNDLRVK